MRKKGAFYSALIKKRRYWQKFIKGNDAKAKFSDREVGAVNAWPGQMDGVKLHVSFMKEPDNAMSLMATYGTTDLMGDTRLQA